MTEAQWLSGAPNPGLSERMLAVVRGCGNDRQFRLLACAEVRRYVWLDHGSAQALELAEHLADGKLTHEEVLDFNRRMSYAPLYEPLNPLVTPAIRFVENAVRAGDPIQRFPPLLRDIFGNPFRPVRFDPEWRTGDAVALARAMYDSRDFSAMPILADALQDAGCASDDILNHCRDTSLTHVRGCWVVDLVLGRE
jgi:hypothetical protein